MTWRSVLRTSYGIRHSLWMYRALKSYVSVILGSIGELDGDWKITNGWKNRLYCCLRSGIGDGKTALTNRLRPYRHKRNSYWTQSVQRPYSKPNRAGQYLSGFGPCSSSKGVCCTQQGQSRSQVSESQESRRDLAWWRRSEAQIGQGVPGRCGLP